MKQLAQTTVTLFIVLLLLYVAWELREAAWLFLFSLTIAAAFQPTIQTLTNWGLSRSIAVAVSYMVGLGGIGLLIVILMNPLLIDFENLVNEGVFRYDELLMRWPTGNALQQMVAQRMPPSNNIYEYLADEQGFPLLQTVLGFTSGLITSFTSFTVIVVLSLYWAVDRVRFEQLWLSLIPAAKRGRARTIWQAIEAGTGEYVRQIVAQSLLIGALLGFGYWMFGVKFPILLAVLSAFVKPVPIVGHILLFTPAVVLILTVQVEWGLLVAGYVLFTLIAQHWLTANLAKKQNVNAMLLVLTMLALMNQVGLIGLLLAPPLAVAIQILFDQLLKQQPLVVSAETIPKLITLKARLDQLQAMMDQHDEPLKQEIVSLTSRLNGLVKSVLTQSEANSGVSRE